MSNSRHGTLNVPKGEIEARPLGILFIAKAGTILFSSINLTIKSPESVSEKEFQQQKKELEQRMKEPLTVSVYYRYSSDNLALTVENLKEEFEEFSPNSKETMGILISNYRKNPVKGSFWPKNKHLVDIQFSCPLENSARVLEIEIQDSGVAAEISQMHQNLKSKIEKMEEEKEKRVMKKENPEYYRKIKKDHGEPESEEDHEENKDEDKNESTSAERFSNIHSENWQREIGKWLANFRRKYQYVDGINKEFLGVQAVLDKPALVIAASLDQGSQAQKEILYIVSVLDICAKEIEELKEEDYKWPQVLVTGYMRKKDLQQYKHKMERFKEEIFAKPPAARDVKQGALGNCYMLSAVNAILTSPNGVDFIQSMMCQRENDTIVRFFDKNNSLVYISVPNEWLVYTNGKAVSRHTAKWLYILEVAYAGFLSLKKEEAISSILSISQGGLASAVLQAFTGQLSKKTSIAEPPAPTESMFQELDLLSKCEEDKIPHMIETGQIPLIYAALDNKIDLLIEWNRYLKSIREGDGEFYNEMKAKFCKNEAGQIKIEGLIRYLDGELSEELKENPKEGVKPPPKIAGSALAKYLKKFSKKQPGSPDYFLVPGPSCSGQYTEYQRDLYDELEKLHQQGHVLVADTPPDFKNVHDLRVMSETREVEKNVIEFKCVKAGLSYRVMGLDNQEKRGVIPWEKLPSCQHNDKEILRKKKQFLPKILNITSGMGHTWEEYGGLVSLHAYAITGFKRDGKKLIISLKNPWDRQGCKYINDKLMIDPERPEFDLDFSDFTKFYSSYHVGSPLSAALGMEEKNDHADEESVEEITEKLVSLQLTLSSIKIGLENNQKEIESFFENLKKDSDSPTTSSSSSSASSASRNSASSDNLSTNYLLRSIDTDYFMQSSLSDLKDAIDKVLLEIEEEEKNSSDHDDTNMMTAKYKIALEKVMFILIDVGDGIFPVEKVMELTALKTKIELLGKIKKTQGKEVVSYSDLYKKIENLEEQVKNRVRNQIQDGDTRRIEELNQLIKKGENLERDCDLIEFSIEKNKEAIKKLTSASNLESRGVIPDEKSDTHHVDFDENKGIIRLLFGLEDPINEALVAIEEISIDYRDENVVNAYKTELIKIKALIEINRDISSVELVKEIKEILSALAIKIRYLPKEFKVEKVEILQRKVEDFEKTIQSLASVKPDSYLSGSASSANSSSSSSSSFSTSSDRAANDVPDEHKNSISWQSLKPENIPVVCIPANGDCLYLCIVLGYLSAVLNNRTIFKERITKLTGVTGDKLEDLCLFLTNNIPNALKNIEVLKRPEFKGLVKMIREHHSFGNNLWGGPNEIQYIAEKLDISIQEWRIDDNQYIQSDLTPPQGLRKTVLHIVQDRPSVQEVEDQQDDLLMQMGRVASVQAGSSEQHYRFLPESPLLFTSTNTPVTVPLQALPSYPASQSPGSDNLSPVSPAPISIKLQVEETFHSSSNMNNASASSTTVRVLWRFQNDPAQNDVEFSNSLDEHKENSQIERSLLEETKFDQAPAAQDRAAIPAENSNTNKLAGITDDRDERDDSPTPPLSRRNSNV